MRTFNTTILIAALTFPCAGLSSERHDFYPAINSALSIPELRFVLATTKLIIATLERELDAAYNNPYAKRELEKELLYYYANVIKITLEIMRRSR